MYVQYFIVGQWVWPIQNCWPIWSPWPVITSYDLIVWVMQVMGHLTNGSHGTWSRKITHSHLRGKGDCFEAELFTIRYYYYYYYYLWSNWWLWVINILLVIIYFRLAWPTSGYRSNTLHYHFLFVTFNRNIEHTHKSQRLDICLPVLQGGPKKCTIFYCNDFVYSRSIFGTCTL